MTGIQYVTGDATYPTGDGDRYILHVVNDVGAWGAGFTRSLSDRWRLPESMYRTWYHDGHGWGQPFRLGSNLYSRVEDDLVVVSMVAQQGLRSVFNPRPLNYAALGMCLWPMRQDFGRPVSVHMPRIGCGLAGGDWTIVKALIDDALIQHNIPVTVYNWSGPE